MMPLAPPIPSRSVRPCHWFPARNGISRSMTASHDPGSGPIRHRAPSFSPSVNPDRLACHLTLLNIIDKLATIFPTKPILVEDRPRIAPGCTRFRRLLGIRKGFNRAKDEHPLTAVQRRRNHRAAAKTYASLVESRLKMLKKLVGRRLQIKRLVHRTCVLLLSKKSKLLGRLGCNLDPGPRWISE
jgi:hypothetical protein